MKKKQVKKKEEKKNEIKNKREGTQKRRWRKTDKET